MVVEGVFFRDFNLEDSGVNIFLWRLLIVLLLIVLILMSCLRGFNKKFWSMLCNRNSLLL